ncbi:MAG: GNAT family protein [Gemmatimonadaceae bacterium]
MRLIPMRMEHLDALCAIGLEPSIWRWMPFQVRDRAGMQGFISDALAEQEHGSVVPYVTTLADSGAVVGSTRFMSIVRPHGRVEIGGTWIAPAYQRTRVNTEAKYLMLRHAFEAWQCQRVEFKTNSLNAPSRAALLRLGAVEEGTFRKHMWNQDGSVRHSVYFSIVDDEWPQVKSRLEAWLAA